MASVRKLPELRVTVTLADGSRKSKSSDKRPELEAWAAAHSPVDVTWEKLPKLWQAQFRAVPGGPQFTKTAARKADVQAWLDQRTAELVRGSFIEPKAGRLTLREFYADWSTTQLWAPNTLRAMDLAVLSTPFVDRPLKAIKRPDIERWIKTMSEGSSSLQGGVASRSGALAPGTIHTRVGNLRTVLRAAVIDEKIAADPSMGVTLPRVRRAEVAMTIPSTHQVRQILDAAAPEYRALIALCAFAGLRLGEAAALQVGDVDFLRREIHVRRQVQRENAGVVDIRAPKHGSERVVAAADGLLALLAAHIELRGLQGEKAAWLFPGEREQPAHQNTVGHAWRTAKARAGIEGYRLHDLRHFYASGLIAAGCDIATVQHALGHSSPSVTLNTYTHLWPKADDRTRAAAQGLVDTVLSAADESVTNQQGKAARFRG